MVDGQVMSGVYPETKLYAGSVPGASSAEFRQYTDVVMEQPAVDLRVASPQRFPVRTQWLGGSPRPTLSISPQAVYADRGSEADLAGVEVRDKLVVVDLPADADQTGLAVVVASIASAGGRFVLFHVVEPAVKPAARLQAASGKQLPLPAAVMENTDAAGRLIDLVKAAPIGLAVATIPQTPFQYKLDFVDRHAAAAAVARWRRCMATSSASRTAAGSRIRKRSSISAPSSARSGQPSASCRRTFMKAMLAASKAPEAMRRSRHAAERCSSALIKEMRKSRSSRPTGTTSSLLRTGRSSHVVRSKPRASQAARQWSFGTSSRHIGPGPSPCRAASTWSPGRGATGAGAKCA
jgi:hypothetical protein